MKKPFKFRYVNEIVGGFVVLVLFLLVAGIVLTGRAQGWFEPVYLIRAAFPEEGSMGLRPGSEVRVLDTPAGTVQDIQPRADGVMEGVFRVRGRFFQYIRDDSTGVVKRTFGVAGDAYLEITRGFGDPLPDEYGYIPVIKDTELLDLAESLLEEVRTTTVPAIEQLQQMLEEYTALAEELRAPEGEVQQLLASLNRLVQSLEADLALITGDVAQATAHLPRMADRLAGELEDVPGLVYQTQATLQEAEVLIEGIQRHWLIRRHIEKDQRLDSGRLPPSVIVGAEGGGQ
jgi:phospholipid/cholesterol/gamma-HCH transport system substrate-binding protein